MQSRLASRSRRRTKGSKQGEFHGQMQWLVFGMARTLHKHVNPANRLLPRPAEMSDAVARLRKETNARPEKLMAFICKYCVPCSRSEGTSIVLFKAAVARFLGCLSEEVGGIMARKGLPAEGESRGACARETKGRVAV